MNDSTFVINAFLSEPNLVQILVENIANSHTGSQNCHRQTPIGWKAIDTASLECFATVDLEIRFDRERIKLPVTNCFVFTCNKFKGTGYSLAWIRSLS